MIGWKLGIQPWQMDDLTLDEVVAIKKFLSEMAASPPLA